METTILECCPPRSSLVRTKAGVEVMQQSHSRGNAASVILPLVPPAAAVATFVADTGGGRGFVGRSRPSEARCARPSGAIGGDAS